MLPREQKKTWNKFYQAAHHNSDLDRRTTVLLHLASAMALGCYP